MLVQVTYKKTYNNKRVTVGMNIEDSDHTNPDKYKEEMLINIWSKLSKHAKSFYIPNSIVNKIRALRR